MSHRLIEHTNPRVFHDAVMEHLLRSEPECCAQIGFVRRMARDGYSPTSPEDRDQPLLWTIQNGERVDLIAIQTLKNKMIVTRGSSSAMECLADALASRQWDGRFLIGVVPSIGSLVERYALLSFRPRKLSVRLRAFQLDRVIWPQKITGIMRLCRHEDRELLARYMVGFETDIGEPSEEDALTRADRTIADQRMFVWADPKPVAIAAWAGPTPNGIRVNWVYTPPEFRGRSYASNLVAHLTPAPARSRPKILLPFHRSGQPHEQ